MDNRTKKGKDFYIRLAVIAFFIIVLVVGLLIYTDYGVSVDEPMQRRHSLINYKYINEKLFDRKIPYLEERNDPELQKYAAKQYGVALQLPTVLVEDLHNFEMTDYEIFHMRHLYNFSIYYLGLIALFFFIKELLHSELIGLIGTAIFYLFPHFFASSYYNVKDLLFVPMFIISCFFMLRMLTRQRKIVYCILFALTTALATNIRILGVMTLPAAFIAMLAEDGIRRFSTNEAVLKSLPDYRRQSVWRRVLPYLIITIGAVGLMLLIAPASWEDPVAYLKLVVGRSLEYEVWTRTMVFMGQSLTWDYIPPYYLPVWMGITIPLFTLLMFVVGCVFLLRSVIRKGRVARFIKQRYLWIVFLFFLAPFLMQVVGGIKIYLGWRHMYVLMVPLTVLAAYGIQQSYHALRGHSKKALRLLVPVLTSAGLLVGVVRVATNHPYQYSLFNAVGIPHGAEFDRDYYRMSAKQCLEYVLKRKPEGKVTVKSGYSLNTPKMGLPTEDAERITLRGGDRPAEYYIELFRDYPGNEPNVPGYTEIDSIWQDGYKLASIMLNDFIYEYEQTGVMHIPVNYFFSNSENIYAPEHRRVRSSIGVEEYMLFGPYLQFGAGEYNMEMDLILKAKLPDTQQVATVDIAGKSGSEVYAGVPILASDFVDGKLHIQLPYTLDTPVYDLEIRVKTEKGVWMYVADDVVVSKTGEIE